MYCTMLFIHILQWIGLPFAASLPIKIYQVAFHPFTPSQHEMTIWMCQQTQQQGIDSRLSLHSFCLHLTNHQLIIFIQLYHQSFHIILSFLYSHFDICCYRSHLYQQWSIPKYISYHVRYVFPIVNTGPSSIQQCPLINVRIFFKHIYKTQLTWTEQMVILG